MSTHERHGFAEVPLESQFFRSICFATSNYAKLESLKTSTDSLSVSFESSGKGAPTLSTLKDATGENFYLDWSIESFYSYESSQLRYTNFRLVGYAVIDSLYADMNFDVTGSHISENLTSSAFFAGIGNMRSQYLPLRTTEASHVGESLSCCPVWSDVELADIYSAYIDYTDPDTTESVDTTSVDGTEISGSSNDVALGTWYFSVVYNGFPFMQEDTITCVNYTNASTAGGSSSSPWNGYVTLGSTINSLPYTGRYTLNRHSASSVTYIDEYELTVSNFKFVDNDTALLSLPEVLDSNNSSVVPTLYYYGTREFIARMPQYPKSRSSGISNPNVFYTRSPIPGGINVSTATRIGSYFGSDTVTGYTGAISRPVRHSRSYTTANYPSEFSGTVTFWSGVAAADLVSLIDDGAYTIGNDTEGQYDTVSAGVFISANDSSSNKLSAYGSKEVTTKIQYVPKNDDTYEYGDARLIYITWVIKNDGTGDDNAVTWSVSITNNKYFSISSTAPGNQYIESIEVDVYLTNRDWEAIESSGSDSNTRKLATVTSYDTTPGNRLYRNLVYNAIQNWSSYGDVDASYGRNGYYQLGSRWQAGTGSNGQNHGLLDFTRLNKLRQFNSSVRISYKSSPHSVLVLNGHLMPVPSNTELQGAKELSISLNTIPYLTKTTFKYVVTPEAVVGASMPVVEVYRAKLDETAVKSDSWIACGSAVDIQSGDEINLECTEGDSYYQSWDCYHCGSYSSTSINSVIDTFKLPIESWTNLHGRYDVYKDIDDISGVDMDDFFKVNDVYSQQNNLITYSYHSSTQTDSVDEYLTSVVWSSAMAYGVDNDPWSEIYLANMVYMDGNCGEIKSLNLFNGNLYCFQDRGLSVIKYNENVQLDSSSGSAISLGNSGVVDGYDLIAKELGVTDFNKVCCTHENMYFADHNRQAIFQVGREGITNLSDNSGFHSFFQEYSTFLDEWSCVDFAGIKLNFDPENAELLIQLQDETLAYNEQLKQFSAFYDYKGYTTLTPINGLVLVTSELESGGQELSSLRTGEYNSFFGKDYDYALTILPCAEPTKNKIWSNLDLRSDKWDEVRLYDKLYTLESGNFKASAGVATYVDTIGTSGTTILISTDNFVEGETYNIAATIENNSSFESFYIKIGIASISTGRFTDLFNTITVDTSTYELDYDFVFDNDFVSTQGSTTGNYFCIEFKQLDNSTTISGEIEITNLVIALTYLGQQLVRTTFDNIKIWNEFQDSGTKKLTELIPKYSPLKEKFRVWRAQLPRDAENRRDRINNPWCYIKLSSNTSEDNDKCKFVLHDIDVWYV